MDLQEIKQKLFNKFAINGWDKVFRSFVYSTDFDDIITKLWELSNDNKKFTPPLKQVFRAFEECPYDNLQVVIIGQDPYPQLGVADGISFSCSNTNKLQPSLRFILEEVNRTVYNNEVIIEDLDLKIWSNQGILMLNTALTTEVGNIGSHYDIWRPFTTYLLDWLNINKSELVYVYMGKKAEEWSSMTDDTNIKYFVKHPASAAYNGSKWDSKDLFNKINLHKKIVW
jgi:uracil-DNA glycosylase